MVPAVVMSGIAVFYKRSYTDLHNALLGLMLTQSLVLIVTDSIKVSIYRVSWYHGQGHGDGL